MARPSILVFLSDDHGQWASRPYGNRELVTPTLDYLARTGARMENAFTPCPVCSPARASFHTGRIPSAHGIHDHIDEQSVGAGHPGIAGQTSLAEVLQEQGYQTGLVGKWHLNHFRQSPPGWDTWFSNATGTNARFGAQPFYEGSRRVELHGNQAHYLADRAVRFLRERDRERPFYLFVGFTNTHTPHEGEPERWVQRYRECSFADLPDAPPSRAHGRLRFHYPTESTGRREANAQYYAAVSVIDEMAGRVLDELADQQAVQDTLVVYTSDHGHMNGHHGLHTKGNATVPQNLLEESIRVPCLLSWPGRIRAAAVHPQPVDHCDLFMTLADAAGCDCTELAGTRGRTGSSCLPLLGEAGAEAAAAAGAWRDAQVCEYGNARMIRTDRHKLIRRYAGPNGHFADELYDLAEDPDEEHNRVSPDRLFGTEQVWVHDARITITDLERTLLDGLSRPRYCGDFAEVLHAFEVAKNRMDVTRITEYAMRLGTATAKRLGWTLAYCGCESSEVDRLAQLPTRGYRTLDPTGPRKGRCSARWMVQENLPGWAAE